MAKRKISKKQKVADKKASRGKTSAIRATAGSEWMGDSSMYKPVKRPITVRLDADVLAWFQKKGKGYQTRINQTLREVMLKERKKG